MIRQYRKDMAKQTKARHYSLVDQNTTKLTIRTQSTPLKLTTHQMLLQQCDCEWLLRTNGRRGRLIATPQATDQKEYYSLL